MRAAPREMRARPRSRGPGMDGGGLRKGAPRVPLCPFTPPPTPVERSLEVAGSGEASARSQCLTFIAYKILKIPLVTCAALPNSAQSIPRSHHDLPGLVAWGGDRDCCKSSSHKSLLPILGGEMSPQTTPGLSERLDEASSTSRDGPRRLLSPQAPHL